MFVEVVMHVSSCRCVMSVCGLFTCVVRGACQLMGNTHENSSRYSLTLYMYTDSETNITSVHVLIACSIEQAPPASIQIK